MHELRAPLFALAAVAVGLALVCPIRRADPAASAVGWREVAGCPRGCRVRVLTDGAEFRDGCAVFRGEGPHPAVVLRMRNPADADRRPRVVEGDSLGVAPVTGTTYVGNCVVVGR